MLKSTHRSAPVAPSSSLPDGWTEHKAPTGHTYYYNAAAKTSTYTRPQATVIAPPLASEPHASQPATHGLYNQLPVLGPNGYSGSGTSFAEGSHRSNTAWNGQRHSGAQRTQPRDRPKSKVAIPGSEPWVLVTTRLGRRFVHNIETKDSYWRFPPDVLKNVVELDRQNREKRLKTEHVPSQQVSDLPEPTASLPLSIDQTVNGDEQLGSDSEYEEVEVTDDEDEAEKTENAEAVAEPQQPVEFDEDDIAYQLQAMGQDYGLDPGEYGDGDGEDIEEGAEGLPLTEDDAKALFKDLLNDYEVSPFTTWDALIEAGNIIEDDRYLALPNMRSRKEVWAEWSKDKTHEIKERRAFEAKKDPKIPYFEFLEARATPKLYWPEFRRKYQKEPEMRNTKLTDKDREKWYREYINRLKLPEQTLKSDFVTLLKSLPSYAMNRSTTLENLPPALVTDLRYISLRMPVRNPLIEAHARTLGPAPVNPELSAEQAHLATKEKEERERREKALAERQRLVEQTKRKQEGALRYGKGMLREGEYEMERANQVSRQGLLGHLGSDGGAQE